MEPVSKSWPPDYTASGRADREGEAGTGWLCTAQKLGVTIKLLFSLITCITLLTYNILAIIVGHVALRYVSIYPSSARAFLDADPITTLHIAIIGSSVLAIPLFVATTLSIAGAVAYATRSPDTQQIEGGPGLPGLSRPVPPGIQAVLWEVWMISAAPMGLLLCESIFLKHHPGSSLDAGSSALAGLAGRSALHMLTRGDLSWRLRAQPPDRTAGAEPEIDHFSAKT